MSKGYKGGDFEREICKRLSRWWTGGKRDDVFWRSSQSGGRATQRAKSGLRTYGSYGDIAAVDPIGEPLLKLMTLELKRGSSHSYPGDLLDFKELNKSHPWAVCLVQAVRCHVEAGSAGWAMICRRDHRIAIIYLDLKIAKLLKDCVPKLLAPPCATFKLLIQNHLPNCHPFVGMPLEAFLSRVSPKQIIQCVENHP